jgi:alcohol dehydrogenase
MARRGSSPSTRTPTGARLPCVSEPPTLWIRHQDVLALTDGFGVDVAIEAVGVPATFQMCLDLVRPGGHVANVGVHGSPVQLDLQGLWIQNIVISTGLVNTTSLPMLLKLVASGKLPAAELVTHRFDMSDILSAYDTFGRAAETRALKVLMHR